MANATLQEITKALGDDLWILEHLTADECTKLGEDLEGFTKAMRKSIYTVNTVLGVTGEEVKPVVVSQVKYYLNSTTTDPNTPTP